MKFLRKQIGVIIYFLIWVLLIAMFWINRGDSSNAMGFGLLAFWIVLPLSSFVIAFLYGKREGYKKWGIILVFGIMAILCQSLTFDLANTLSSGKIHIPEWKLVFWGAIPAFVGMGLGYMLKKRKK